MVVQWEPLHNPIIQFFLSLPVYVLGLWFFGKSAYHSLKSGVPNMDVLIFIGAFSAFFYSVFGTIYFWGTHQVHEYLFFETGATIITLVLFGNIIEKRSVKRTTNSIKSLTSLQVKTAKVISQHNNQTQLHDVEVSLLRKGDLLQINNGDIVPIDVMLVGGEGDCDESMMSGESLPVHKKIGDALIGGTILVNGNIQAKVTAHLKDSVLSQIIEMVKKAQASKPQIQKLGDQVSAIFVPVVVSISIITFFVSFFILDIGSAHSMMRAVAVLVISCPCAMGLATPTAIMVGIGKAAKRGILIKGGDVLENFAKTKQIIFDKTGTLSTGHFVFDDFWFSESDSNELRNIIYNLENHSSHPIAKAFVSQYASWFTEKLSFQSIEEIKGAGLIAKDLAGFVWKLGSEKFVGSARNEKDLFLTKNDVLVASFNLKDELKEGSAQVVEYFKNNNVKPILLSGDHESKVKLVAQKLGIEAYFAGQLPQQKLAYIESQLDNKEPIVMVGGDIASLQEAHQISILTYKTIKQNLFWAFFYNIICIPLAAAGFMHPMLGALSMAFSDVIVIGNSLWLGIKKTNTNPS
jgi:Cu+-exporting ATPase